MVMTSASAQAITSPTMITGTTGLGYDLDEMFNFMESMAEYEAEQEAEKEDVTEYVKGKAINIGEEV